MGKKFVDLANLKSNLENFFSEIISPTFATKEEISEQLGSHTVKSDVPENAVFTDTVYDDTDVQKRISDNGYGEVAGGKNLLNHNIIDSKMRNCSVLFKNDTFYATNKGSFSLFVLRVPTIVGKSYTVTIKDWSDYSYRCIASVSDLSDNTLVSMAITDAALSMAFTAVGTESLIQISPNNTPNEMSNTITFKCMLEEGSVATEYEPYFPSNKMLAEEKADKTEITVNLLNPTLQTTTSNGVTCTNNGDGTYTLNGTASRLTTFILRDMKLDSSLSYKLTGCPLGGDWDNGYSMYVEKQYWGIDVGKGCEITLTDADNICGVYIRIIKDTVCNNLVFKPMLTTNLDATYDDFVPYTGDTGKLNSDVAELKNNLSKLQDNVDSSDIQYSAYIKNANGDITPSGITSSPKINEAVSQINNNIGVLLQGHNEQKSNLDNLSASNAGAHNSVYCGKYLGNALTTEQKAQISAGTFNDLYIGDYWTIGGVNYRIAAFDYWLNSGDTQCTTHHIVIVPDSCLYNAQMNTSDITTGAYVGSAMYTSNLEQAKTTINNAFGSIHILSHREYLPNATKANSDPTYESAGSWYDSTVELMNERMVYGADVFHNIEVNGAIPYNYTIDKSQLPLFALEPNRISNCATWWLRDVVSAASFAFVGGDGLAIYYDASNSYGVRPVFGIKG